MVLLIDRNALGGWPKHVAAKAIGPRGFVFVSVLLPVADCARVIGADGVEAVGVAISSHVMCFLHLGASAFMVATASVWVADLVVVHFGCHLGDCCCQLLDLCFHGCNFLGGLHVRGLLVVGAIASNLLDPFA